MLKRIVIAVAIVCLGGNPAWGLENPFVAAVPTVTTPKPAELSLIRYQQTHDLPEEIQAMMQKDRIPADHLSVYIRDLNANAPLVLHNDNVPRNPASTMKLVTTWTALKSLSPSYTWKTEVWARGNIKDGVLNGDLLLKGFGDPFLTDEAFWQLLHDLQLKGVKAITGNLVVDNSFFNLPPQDPAAFDGEPSKVYNAPPSALMYNFQATRFLFEADTATHRVNISPFPVVPGLQIDNQVNLSSRNSCAKGDYHPYFNHVGSVVTVTGTYAQGCGKNFIMRVMSTPEEHVFNAFRDVWHAQGGQFNGKLQVGTVQPGDTLLHTQESRTLGEQIRFINKWSNNVMARELFLTIGAQLAGAPATLAKSQKAVAMLLTAAGVDVNGMVVENGAGLSRQERISAQQLGQLLESAWRDPYMPEFMASLPLLGEDGTLAERFKNDDLRGRSHMKTGTLRDTTAIAGYMLTRTGKRLVVVLQHNGAESGGSGRRLQDAILRWAFEQ